VASQETVGGQQSSFQNAEFLYRLEAEVRTTRDEIAGRHILCGDEPLVKMNCKDEK
jgi:hypothetical protein